MKRVFGDVGGRLLVGVCILAFLVGCEPESEPVSPVLKGNATPGERGSFPSAAAETPAGFEKLAEHRVEKGDTLYSIARKHYQDGSKWPAIVSANSATLSGPEDLNVGQVLLIPTVESPALLTEQSVESSRENVELPAVHVLKAGETMYSLSVKYYGTGDYVGLILRANEDAASRASDLQIGDEITIPALPDEKSREPQPLTFQNG